MSVIEITSLSHPGVEIFSTLTEAQLRHQVDAERGLFIAESPKVIQVALDKGYEPLALLSSTNTLPATRQPSSRVAAICLSTRGRVRCWPHSRVIHSPGAYSVPCAALSCPM